MGRSSGDVYVHPDARRLLATVDEALSVADCWTPRDALLAKEPAEHEEDADEALSRLRVVTMVRSFICFAEFMSAGVTQAHEVEVRSLIVLRAAAPRVLWDFYKLKPVDVRKREAELRRMAKRQRWHPQHHGKAVSLNVLLRGQLENEEHALAERLDCAAVELRRLHLEAFCRMIADEARTLKVFPKIALAFLRRAKPDFLHDLGDSQAAIGRKYNEQRATVSAREIRVVEDPLTAAGVKGVHLLGGTKSDSHRAACAEAQMGNTNRADGEARKRGEHPVSEDFEREQGARSEEQGVAAKRVAAARRAYEERRLVELFGPGVAGCDPERTLPMRDIG